MTRRKNWLRAALLPLFALASLIVCVWGVAGWWKFHRDLYVEEEAALVALAKETGTLRYRRAGALRSKTLEASALEGNEPSPVPWSVPFVGRVEAIDASQGLRPHSAGVALAQGTYPLHYAAAAYVGPTSANLAAMAAAATAGGPVTSVPGWPNPTFAAALQPGAPLPPGVPPLPTKPQTTAPQTTPAARDRALRLPGLVEFRDLPPRAIDAQPIDLSTLSLTLPPPKFPTAYLHPDHLNEAFPTGEAVDESERESLAAEIADAWAEQAKKDRSEEKPRLIYAHRRTIDTQLKKLDRSTSIRLRDGKRRFDFSGLPHELDASPRSPVNLRVSTELGDWEFLVTKTHRYPLARRTAPDAAAFDDAPDLPHALGRPFDPYGHMEPLPDDPLGDGGRRIFAIERIDRDRLRIEARSSESEIPGEEYWRFRAVVRSDLEYAVEQYDWYLQHGEPRPDPSLPRDFIYREIRWLSRRKGTTVVTERLSDPWPISPTMAPLDWDATISIADQAPPARVAMHTLIATTVDPIYPKEIFDPAMYDGKTWPEPRELPAYRADQFAMGLGAIGLALAGAIAFLRSLFVRRRGSDVDRRRQLLALRFGLVTALAAALLAISGAGWFKVRVDEARDQQALLSELVRLDERLRFERGEPEFPWLFISTEAFPIGTELTRVDLGPQPSPELLERLVASSPDLRLEIRERRRRSVADRKDIVVQALGSELPEFETFDWGAELIDKPIERGVPLTPEENGKALADMLAAWNRGKENRPTRYLLRQESSVAAIERGIAVRDGARSWAIDSGEFDLRIDTDDGRVRRRFGRAGEEWVLTDRRPANEERPPFYVPPRFPFGEPPRAKSILVNPPQGSIPNGAAPPTDPYAVPSPTESASVALSMPSTEEILLPAPPFALPPGVSTAYRVDEKLITDRDNVLVSFERLPAGDLRAELAWGDWDGGQGLKATWILHVRPDLDWCVEKCHVDETYERAVTDEELDLYRSRDFGTYQNARRVAAGRGSVNRALFQRKIYSRHALERRDGHPILLEAKLVGGETLLKTPIVLDRETIRYAVDFEPVIDSRRFDRATLDSPDPPRRIEPWLPWHRATFFVGIALLGYAGVRRGIDVWHARRSKKSKPLEEQQESEPPSAAAPSDEAPR